MNSDFEIKYKFHWCGPCEEFGDTKEETIIRSDGSVLVKSFDHHGPNGHFRLTDRARGSAEPEDVCRLYEELVFYRPSCGPIFAVFACWVFPGRKIRTVAGLAQG